MQQDQIIQHNGDTWRVVGRGVTNEAGETYCHLCSTTRSWPTKRGPYPVQNCDWVPAATLAVREG